MYSNPRQAETKEQQQDLSSQGTNGVSHSQQTAAVDMLLQHRLTMLISLAVYTNNNTFTGPTYKVSVTE